MKLLNTLRYWNLFHKNALNNHGNCTKYILDYFKNLFQQIEMFVKQIALTWKKLKHLLFTYLYFPLDLDEGIVW